MKVVRGFNEDTCLRIAKNCGSEAMRKEIPYLRFQVFHGGSKVVVETIDDTAFFAVYIGKKNVRLIFIASESGNQNKGYGTIMFRRIISLAEEAGVEKITWRTSREEDAYRWYLKLGAEITGINGSDYEMEYVIGQD